MDDQSESRILEAVRGMLELHCLCNHCLGRQFAWLSTDSSNEERGEALKLTLSMMADEDLKAERLLQGSNLIAVLASNGMFNPAKSLAEKNGIEYKEQTSCHLCSINGNSIFDALPSISERAIEALEGTEFRTFLVGCVPSSVLTDREDEMRGVFGLMHGEALKADFNRELGKTIQLVLEKQVDFQSPDIVVVYDMGKDRIKINRNPIFIEGRYRKLTRGIPQSRWDCSDCRGKGCDACNNTGRRYPDSIAEYIGAPTQSAAQGTKFKFHAAGREDIDVLMLGSGRPFVIEVSEPRVRTPDLQALAGMINDGASEKIEVQDLQISTRKRAQSIKEDASENVKEYAAIIRTANPVKKSDLKKVSDSLSGVDLEQRTPTRVAHRRSDLVRKKHIYETNLKPIDNNTIEGYFKVQGGTYVKELVSGDEGRTSPSVAGLLNMSCECIELNVTAIYEGDAP